MTTTTYHYITLSTLILNTDQILKEINKYGRSGYRIVKTPLKDVVVMERCSNHKKSSSGKT